MVKEEKIDEDINNRVSERARGDQKKWKNNILCWYRNIYDRRN